MSASKPRVLIADDEPKYVRSLTLILQAKGYEVLAASDGALAVELAARAAPDMCLLDVRIPKLSGWEMCREIRKFSLAPILMVTALGQEADIVAGLEAGADDYVVKPFAVEGLLARLEIALGWLPNSPEPPAAEAVYQLKDLKVDYGRRQAFMAQRLVPLTAAEYRLLCELTLAGRALSSDVLFRSVWGPDRDDADPFVPIFIQRLRQKIEANPAAPEYILTRPGKMYSLGKPGPS